MPKRKPAPDLSLPTVVESLGSSIVIEMELKNGNFGRANDWHWSSNQRKKFLRYFKQNGWVFRPLDYPVKVRVTRLIGHGQRAWDAMSVMSGTTKELFDVMVECDWFVDDGSKWITAAVGQQQDRRDMPPGIRIEIFRQDEQIIV